MDDLDAVVGEELVEVRVGLRDAERLGARGAALRAAAQDAVDLDADPAQGLDVDGPDEARADDGGSDGGERWCRDGYTCLDSLDDRATS
jgi:hypothetical protein